MSFGRDWQNQTTKTYIVPDKEKIGEKDYVFSKTGEPVPEDAEIVFNKKNRRRFVIENGEKIYVCTSKHWFESYTLYYLDTVNNEKKEKVPVGVELTLSGVNRWFHGDREVIYSNHSQEMTRSENQKVPHQGKLIDLRLFIKLHNFNHPVTRKLMSQQEKNKISYKNEKYLFEFMSKTYEVDPLQIVRVCRPHINMFPPQNDAVIEVQNSEDDINTQQNKKRKFNNNNNK